MILNLGLALLWEMAQTCKSGLVLDRGFLPRLAGSWPSCLRMDFMRSPSSDGVYRKLSVVYCS